MAGACSHCPESLTDADSAAASVLASNTWTVLTCKPQIDTPTPDCCWTHQAVADRG